MNYDVTFEEQNTEFDVDFGENVNIGGGTTVPPDKQMSDTSTNAVQNKVVKAYVDGVANSVNTWANKEHDKLVTEVHEQISADVTDYIQKNLVFKEKGKGLSTNDFTDEYKAKLDALISQLYKDGETNG